MASGGQGVPPGTRALRDAGLRPRSSRRTPQATRLRPPGPGRTSGGALHLDQAGGLRDGVAFECAGVVEVELLQRFAGREPGGAGRTHRTKTRDGGAACGDARLVMSKSAHVVLLPTDLRLGSCSALQ